MKTLDSLAHSGCPSAEHLAGLFLPALEGSTSKNDHAETWESNDLGYPFWQLDPTRHGPNKTMIR